MMIFIINIIRTQLDFQKLNEDNIFLFPVQLIVGNQSVFQWSVVTLFVPLVSSLCTKKKKKNVALLWKTLTVRVSQPRAQCGPRQSNQQPDQAFWVIYEASIRGAHKVMILNKKKKKEQRWPSHAIFHSIRAYQDHVPNELRPKHS